MEDRNVLQPRNIEVNLSDKHCAELLKTCGKKGFSVSEVLEAFVKSLLQEEPVSFMSNQNVLAEKWFEEYSFYQTNDRVLLKWLLEENIVIGDFTQLIYCIEIEKEALKTIMWDFTSYSKEDMESSKKELEIYERELEDYKSRFLAENPTANWEEEVKKVLDYKAGLYVDRNVQIYFLDEEE